MPASVVADDTEQQRHEGPEREITSTRAATLIITIMPRRAPNRNATATGDEC
jgi:hypothetical protein